MALQGISLCPTRRNLCRQQHFLLIYLNNPCTADDSKKTLKAKNPELVVGEMLSPLTVEWNGKVNCKLQKNNNTQFSQLEPPSDISIPKSYQLKTYHS